MADLDSKQINKNRRVMDESTIESPYVPSLGDSDSDLPERLFEDNLPTDKVGFMPPNERNRRR
jgi:hypothetical protein